MFEGSLSLVAYVKIFVAMIVIVNPLGIMPVFVAMTASYSYRERCPASVMNQSPMPGKR